MGASALVLGGNAAQKQAFLPKIVDGSAIFTLAVDEGTRHAPARTVLAATAAGTGFRLNGRKSFVLEGGRLKGMMFEVLEYDLDARGRIVAERMTGEEFYPADDVILAIGQENAFPFI